MTIQASGTQEDHDISERCCLSMRVDFQRPSNLCARVYQNQVVLENIFIRGLTAYGKVRVNNCSFHKRVTIRFTINQWKTYSNLEAHHSVYCSHDNTNIFLFKLSMSKDQLSELPKDILFAVCYNVNGNSFWDNNDSKNYTISIVKNTSEVSGSILDQLSLKSSEHNEALCRQIAQDYHAIPVQHHQIGHVCGLRNLGGTCYMNSILQALLCTSSLTNYFLFDNVKKTNTSEDKLTSNEIIAYEYMNLLYLFYCGRYSVLTPEPFKQVIGHVKCDFFGNRQQDAHEFLMLLLHLLENDFNRVKANELDSRNQISESMISTKNRSIVEDLFHGTYLSIVTCLECLYESKTVEPFVCISLSVPLTNECTLYDCLAYLKEDEYLDNESKWHCSQCNCLRNGKKRVKIHSVPRILIFQLKRFQLSSDMKWIKSNTLIYYPENNFDLCEFTSTLASQKSLYTLYSVINHAGSLEDGHYTAFCRDTASIEKQWFAYDDEKVEFLSLDRLSINPEAYLLFYTMQ